MADDDTEFDLVVFFFSRLMFIFFASLLLSLGLAGSLLFGAETGRFVMAKQLPSSLAPQSQKKDPYLA